MNNTLLELMLHIKEVSSESYLVGGCVRDMLLNKSPKDFDIVGDINIDKLIPILKDNNWKIDEAGKQFFVLIATKNNEQFEIAMYRKDGNYTDGRRPDFVEVGTIYDDALRRDFTINSLYYNPWTNEIKDPTEKGLDDIKNKVIRFNGKADQRIKEDYLRIFRAYRFVSKLNFSMEKKTLKACRTYFNVACTTISGSRIINEIEKMCGI